MKYVLPYLLAGLALAAASPARAQQIPGGTTPSPHSPPDSTIKSSARTDITLGASGYALSVSGHEVPLLALDFEVRYVPQEHHGLLVSAWTTSSVGAYGFGAIDLGYLYRHRLVGSQRSGVDLDLMLGPTIAAAGGCDEYDDSVADDGGSCAGPNLDGMQLGGFVSPTISVHGGHFTATIALTYRLLHQRGDSGKSSRFKGVTVGLGFGTY